MRLNCILVTQRKGEGRGGDAGQGGSGMGGIQGWPRSASRMAARTSAPCLAAVEM